MKILISVTYYYPHWTGLTQYARQLAEGLATRRHDVTVLTTQHSPELKAREVINQVKVVRGKPSYKVSRTLVSGEMIFRIPKLIKENDVIIAFLPINEALWISGWAKALGKKLFLIHNGDLILPKSFTNRSIENIFYLTTGWAVKLATKVITYTIDYAESSKLLRTNLEKCVQILPPVERIEVDAKEKKRLEKKLPAKRNLVVGFAGRFVEEKGFDILLEAMPQVVRKLPGTKFIFAGETRVGYENYWENNFRMIQANKNNIVWYGLLDRKQMGAFYSLCDLFVLSSRSECFGLVQAEAMLLGVPVVVTDIPGARWLVKHTGAGKIVSPENSGTLADAIVNVLTHLTIYKQRTNKAKEIFNKNTFLDEYESLFKKGN